MVPARPEFVCAFPWFVEKVPQRWYKPPTSSRRRMGVQVQRIDQKVRSEDRHLREGNFDLTEICGHGCGSR
jgi:hypothetical protein